MKKRSFFFKEYLTHFILIVVAFALAGSVFYHQMASYALRAKQTELKTTVQSLAEQSKLMQGTDSDSSDCPRGRAHRSCRRQIPSPPPRYS